jgi:hypothetical protein
MGKMVYLVMTVIAVQLTLYLVFDVGFPLASLWLLFLNPQNWDSLSLTAMITDAFTVVGVSAIIVGTLFWRNEFLVFAGLAAVFYSFGKQLVNLWQQIAGQSFFGDAASSSLVASIIVGAIIFLYIFTIFEWWRGRD